MATLQPDIDKICSWCEARAMYLNTEKYYHIQLKTRGKYLIDPIVYFLNSKLVTNVAWVKYLGIICTPILDWTVHMDVLQKRPAAYYNCLKEALKPPPRVLK